MPSERPSKSGESSGNQKLGKDENDGRANRETRTFGRGGGFFFFQKKKKHYQRSISKLLELLTVLEPRAKVVVNVMQEE